MQNPDFRVSPTSGLLEVLFVIRNRWEEFVEHKALGEDESKEKLRRVLAAAMDSYHIHDRPVIFDKSRGWLAHLEMTEWVLGREARVLVPVRDLREILASFEKLWRNSSQWAQLAIEKGEYFQAQTTAGRCALWAREDQPVGLAYNRIKDALQRGYTDRMHFVEYEKLTTRPENTLKGIYRFLGLPYFAHDFKNVEQVIFEDDRVHGMGELHKIRPRVEPQQVTWPQILGPEVANRYANQELW
jgi:sulfotransferase